MNRATSARTQGSSSTPSGAVYQATELSQLFTLSSWAVYQAAKRGDTPIGRLAIKVGRRVLWPKGPVDRLLGGEPSTCVSTAPSTSEGSR